MTASGEGPVVADGVKPPGPEVARFMNPAGARWVSRASRWIESLEQIPIGGAGWAAGILAVIGVRHLLEMRSSGYSLYPPSALYAHYVLAYLAPALALSLVLSLCSGVSLQRVLRLMLLAWGLTLLPPLVDTLAARTHAARIGYMDLGETSLPTVVIRFFDPTYALGGTTAGIRVETAIACLLGALYVLLRGRGARYRRSLAAAVLIYLTSLFFFTLPHLFLRTLRFLTHDLSAYSLTGLMRSVGRVARPITSTVRDDQMALLYLVPLTLGLGAASMALSDSQVLARLWKRFRKSEAWPWGLFGALGACAGWRALEGVPRSVAVVPFDGLALVFGPLALCLGGGALALIMEPSDPDDPSGGRSEGSVRAAGMVLLAGAALLGATVSTDLAGFGAIGLGAGLLARGLPRVLPWAVLAPQAASAIAAVSCFLAGYSLLAGDEALTLLPVSLYLLVFLMGLIADLPRAGQSLPGPWPRILSACAAVCPPIILAAALVPMHLPPAWSWIAIAVGGAAATLAAALWSWRSPRLLATISVVAAAAVIASVLSDPRGIAAWRSLALDSPGYYLRAAERAEEAGDLHAAAGAAAEAVRRDPRMAIAHERLGIVRSKQGDHEGALESFRAASRLDPGNANLLGNIASTQLELGHAHEALETVTRGLSQDPRIPSLYFTRAQCLDSLKRAPEADAAWRDYLAHAEGLPDEAPYREVARRRLSEGTSP